VMQKGSAYFFDVTTHEFTPTKELRYQDIFLCTRHCARSMYKGHYYISLREKKKMAYIEIRNLLDHKEQTKRVNIGPIEPARRLAVVGDVIAILRGTDIMTYNIKTGQENMFKREINPGYFMIPYDDNHFIFSSECYPARSSLVRVRDMHVIFNTSKSVFSTHKVICGKIDEEHLILKELSGNYYDLNPNYAPGKIYIYNLVRKETVTTFDVLCSGVVVLNPRCFIGYSDNKLFLFAY